VNKNVKAKALSRKTNMLGNEGLANDLSLFQRCLDKGVWTQG